MINPELNKLSHTNLIFQCYSLNFSFSEFSVTQHLISTPALYYATLSSNVQVLYHSIPLITNS